MVPIDRPKNSTQHMSASNFFSRDNQKFFFQKKKKNHLFN